MKVVLLIFSLLLYEILALDKDLAGKSDCVLNSFPSHIGILRQKHRGPHFTPALSVLEECAFTGPSG